MTALLAADVDWWLQAACRGMDTELFYSDQRGGNDTAKKTCQSCLVRTECLIDAMRNEANEHRYGIRGGLTPPERRALWKQRRQVRADRTANY